MEAVIKGDQMTEKEEGDIMTSRECESWTE
jgi:hypothetical protein